MARAETSERRSAAELSERAACAEQTICLLGTELSSSTHRLEALTEERASDARAQREEGSVWQVTQAALSEATSAAQTHVRRGAEQDCEIRELHSDLSEERAARADLAAQLAIARETIAATDRAPMRALCDAESQRAQSWAYTSEELAARNAQLQQRLADADERLRRCVSSNRGESSDDDESGGQVYDRHPTPRWRDCRASHERFLSFRERFLAEAARRGLPSTAPRRVARILSTRAGAGGSSTDSSSLGMSDPFAPLGAFLPISSGPHQRGHSPFESRSMGSLSRGSSPSMGSAVSSIELPSLQTDPPPPVMCLGLPATVWVRCTNVSATGLMSRLGFQGMLIRDEDGAHVNIQRRKTYGGLLYMPSVDRKPLHVIVFSTVADRSEIAIMADRAIRDNVWRMVTAEMMQLTILFDLHTETVELAGGFEDGRTESLLDKLQRDFESFRSQLLRVQDHLRIRPRALPMPCEFDATHN